MTQRLNPSEGGPIVDLRISAGVGWLTLNDQSRRNSVTARMSREVAGACATCAADLENPQRLANRR